MLPSCCVSDKYIVEKVDLGDPSQDLTGDETGDRSDNVDKSIDMQLEIMPYYLGSEGGFVSVFKKTK